MSSSTISEMVPTVPFIQLNSTWFNNVMVIFFNTADPRHINWSLQVISLLLGMYFLKFKSNLNEMPT